MRYFNLCAKIFFLEAMEYGIFVVSGGVFRRLFKTNVTVLRATDILAADI